MGASPMGARAWGAHEEGLHEPGVTWPSRHGVDLAAAELLADRLRRTIAGDPSPSAAQWAELGHALTVGDPLADDVADWLGQVGMRDGWAAIDRLLLATEAQVDESAKPVARLLRAARAEPLWLDRRLLARGARFMQSTGGHGLMVLRDAGLMAGYQASAINQALMMTGALHSGAGRRLAETGQWWMACTADGGLAPGAEGFRATVKVRIMHAMVRRRLDKSPGWDAAYLGRAINQVDLQVTYLAFSVVQLLGLRMMGMRITPSESLAVMHLWRYIAWLMGLDERFLCETEKQGRVALYQNLLSQAPPDSSSELLAKALMAEPFERAGAQGGAWRRRLEWACHLSVARWFIGPEGVRRLGLPVALPWYPLLVIGPLRLWTSALAKLPGLRGWARRRARLRQEWHVAKLVDGHLKGRSVAHAASGCPRL
jgi:hypothetical protein